MSKYSGKCMCESVSYEIDGELGPVVNCHCLKCRRWHNAAFRTRTAVKSRDFHWLKGEECLGRAHSSENVVKVFCKKCGSNLISILENDPNTIGVPVGALEGADDIKPCMHIFVGSKAPWYDITDNLPQYDEWPPGGPDAVSIVDPKFGTVV